MVYKTGLSRHPPAPGGPTVIYAYKTGVSPRPLPHPRPRARAPAHQPTSTRAFTRSQRPLRQSPTSQKPRAAMQVLRHAPAGPRAAQARRSPAGPVCSRWVRGLAGYKPGPARAWVVHWRATRPLAAHPLAPWRSTQAGAPVQTQPGAWWNDGGGPCGPAHGPWGANGRGAEAGWARRSRHGRAGRGMG